MATLNPKKKYWKQGLIGGMNQGVDSALLPDGDAKYLLNITLDEASNWISRPGSSAVGGAISGSDEGWGLFTYDSTDDTYTLMAVSDRDLTSLTEPSTWGDIDSNEWPASTRVDGVNFLDRLYLGSADGETALKYTTGGSVTALTPIIGGSQLEVAKESLIVQGNKIRPDLVFFTNPYTDRFYASTGTASSNADSNGSNTVVTTTSVFEPDDTGAILYNTAKNVMATITKWVSATVPYVETDTDTSTWNNDTVYVLRNRFKLDGAAQGIAAFQEYVVSFDREKGYMWDPTSPTWSRLLPNTGCVNYRTVKVVDNKLLWMGKNAMYLFNGEALPFDLSIKIRNKARFNGVWDLIDYANVDEFCAGVKQGEGKYFLSVGTLKTKAGVFGSGVENAVLVIDLNKDAWILRSYPEQILAFTNFTDANGDTYLYGITDSAQVVKIDDEDETTDWGDAAIPVQVVTADHILGDPSVAHDVSAYYSRYVAASNVTVTESVDKAAYATFKTLEPTSSLMQKMLPAPNRKGIMHSLSYGTSAPFTLEAYAFLAGDENTNRKINI